MVLELLEELYKILRRKCPQYKIRNRKWPIQPIAFWPRATVTGGNTQLSQWPRKADHLHWPATL